MRHQRGIYFFALLVVCCAPADTPIAQAQSAATPAGDSTRQDPLRPGAKQNWMNDALMNLLVDYYPEVQFQTYGSGATRENVLPYLKQLHLGYVCIYAKGPTGVDAEWDRVTLAGDAGELYSLYVSWDHDNSRLHELPNN